MDQWIVVARQPYGTHPTLPPLPSDPMNGIVGNIQEMTWFQSVGLSEVEDTFLLVALALRAYAAEHGSYPETLEALVPTYLKKLPNDPFAANGPLRYKRTGQTYLLYSVGPDGKDDGGAPIDNPPDTAGPPCASAMPTPL